AKIDIDALNSKGFTALDSASPEAGGRTAGDIEIQDYLLGAGATSRKDTLAPVPESETHEAKNLSSPATDPTTTLSSRAKKNSNKHNRRNKRWLNKTRNALMLVASIISTMAFQAGINPPGGVWQVDSETHEAGQSVLATKHPRAYRSFVVYNTISFLASLYVILLLISGLPFKRRFFVWILTVIMCAAIISTGLNYLVCLYSLSKSSELVVSVGVVIYGVIGILLVGHSVRLILRVTKSSKFKKQKQSSSSGTEHKMEGARKEWCDEWRETQLRTLYQAALDGSITCLLRLLEEDKLVLDRYMASCFAETPLHISALLGHVDFTREILTRKPQLAKELDLHKSTPLHLAAANGHLEVVKLLLLVNADICLAQDRDGRNPLHVAVIKGHLEILKELVQAKPEAIQLRGRRGETILHFCVKHFQIDALKFLINLINQDGFVNAKDDDGFTILHLAVAQGETEMINFLITETMIDINFLNSKGFTALDIALAEDVRTARSIEIQDYLLEVGAITAKCTLSTLQEPETFEAKNLSLPETEGIITLRSNVKTCCKHHGRKKKGVKNKRNALMVVASLIATMAFQAGINPPCGVWQNDSDTHEAGHSVLATKHPQVYTTFVAYNTTSFLASLCVILLLISGLPFKSRFSVWILTVIMWIAVASTGLTYTVPLYSLSKSSDSATPMAGVIYGMLSILLVGHSVRLIRKKSETYKKQKKSSSSVSPIETDI
ncbi:hypothetical protein Tsubulata_040315, partial [Turnera subulata]